MKPFDVICIKSFNTHEETSAWGCLELLKIYKITKFSFNEIKKVKRKGVFEIDWVQNVDRKDNANYKKFVVATHKKFQDDDTVPIFREHLRKI
jgi:hypothetical protein